ncbi:MAG: tRNA lysidine(34) synthetase TilS [Chitinispirillales bacterium]|jgi:tRNA(Ile)-lysidine synthase|nr:tRNA lysidine(34) synthetase TilS [Chitinispirillales bacterium]
MSTILEELTGFFKSIGASPSARVSVLAGVSGGADSVALARILHLYSDNLGIGELAVAHVNHGLRGAESDGDEAFARGVAGELGAEFFCVRLDAAGAELSENLESWARDERYKFFHRVKSGRGFGYIATAHTASDQAETLLMRMARGAGVRGLRGVLPVRGDGVIRPFIGVERRQIEEWLGENGYAYRTDSSNADKRFRRNFIRSEVIPRLLELDPAAVRNIAACAESAALAWAAVEERAGAWIGKYALRVSSGIFHIEKAGLSDPAARDALLLLFGSHGIQPTRLHIERVMGAERLASGEHLLPGGWKFYPREDRVCFVKGNEQ